MEAGLIVHSKSVTLKKHYTAGSQMWFSKENFLDRHLRGYGCGVVALHDLSVYKGCAGTSKTRDDYRERIRKTEKAGIFVFPYLGIAPYYYSLMCNLYLRRKHMPFRIGWGHTASAELRCHAYHIKECLKNDMPVIFAAGPTIPFLFKKKKVTLYSRDRKTPETWTKGHYMTVVGVEEDGDEIWLDIVSWGRKYSVKLKDLADHSGYSFPLTTRFYRPYMKKDPKVSKG